MIEPTNELLKDAIWHYFYEISKIPRASKKEYQIVEYIKIFGQSHKLDTLVDSVGNVLIRKPATVGFENMPCTVLQSHLDMVCEKNSDSTHCFETDGIEIVLENGWIKANGTTLGADNGIGIATQLAILSSSKIAHGELECLFTVDEESGLTGAKSLDNNLLKSTRLINLDSEDEGEIYVGCAGGVDTIARFCKEEEPVENGCVAIEVTVRGLKGGHSGDDINKGLANANKIVAHFAMLAIEDYGFKVCHIEGGNLRNAIAREAKLIGTIPSKQKEPLRIAFNLFIHDIEEAYKLQEPNMKLKLGTTDIPQKQFTEAFQNKLIRALIACPHGVIEMSNEIVGLVQTSTNLASIKNKDGEIEVTTSQRSSKEICKKHISEMVESVFILAGATVTHTDGYPGWTPNLNSELLQKAEMVYCQLFSKKPLIKAIHAGLECGLFLEKYPYLDMISIGPTIKGAHSPDERMEIESVNKFWQFLCALLSKK